MERPSNAQRWAGLVMSGLVTLFLFADGVAKLVMPKAVVDGTVDLGYPIGTIVPMGLALLFGVVLYAIPLTAVLGAIWVTGYLGGAIATHVRVEHPLFTHTLFPIYVATLMWGGLALRFPRVRAVLPGER
jgi:hypothetical protein